MAGRARRAAALTELEVRASTAGLTPLEWIEEELSNGVTMVAIADDFTRNTGVEITRNVLDKLCLALEEDAPERLKAAHKAGAHAIVEKQHERLEGIGKNAQGEETMFINKEEISLENLRTKAIQWRAERMNRDDFGAAPQNVLNLSLANLHLDVLRRLSAQDARELQAAPRQLEEGTDFVIESDPESLV